MTEPEEGSGTPETQPEASKMDVESQTANKDHEDSNAPPQVQLFLFPSSANISSTKK